ncbi:MAG TPA: DUF1549 domain-containing protein, partial [Verrucomicrobiae bacterium]
MSIFARLSCLLLAFWAGPALAGNESGAGLLFFENQIRPLLIERCYECHSAQSKTLKGGLRLDSAEGLRKGGNSGLVVVPGAPDLSLLLQAVRYTNADLQMPPKHQLPPESTAALEHWIKIGAPDPRTNSASSAAIASLHWAFQPIKKPSLPYVGNKRWPANEIDRFILAKLEKANLSPSPAAEKRTLIRRATYNLIGLPPTPEEIEAFIHDSSPRSYESLLERLLNSPHYGERWGRYWLDLARYADTAGDNADFPIPQAWLYRNYVIDAFNSDKPYTQFIREQIAGDLLPFANEKQWQEQVVATGFIALARRFSVDPDSVHHLTIEDAMDTMSRSMLGLSLSCARCHDHKYDPIPTKDYYALYGIFQSTRFPYPGSENKKRQRDFVSLMSREQITELTLD